MVGIPDKALQATAASAAFLRVARDPLEATQNKTLTDPAPSIHTQSRPEPRAARRVTVAGRHLSCTRELNAKTTAQNRSATVTEMDQVPRRCAPQFTSA